MSIEYHCPRCQSFQVIVNATEVFCFNCRLTFDKKFLQLLDDEDILANEELEGIIDILVDD
jgi:hypothetical protein